MSSCSAGSFQPIFSDAFDSQTFATQIIQYQAVGETLGKLESSITKLDDELYRQVCGDMFHLSLLAIPMNVCYLVLMRCVLIVLCPSMSSVALDGCDVATAAVHAALIVILCVCMYLHTHAHPLFCLDDGCGDGDVR